MSGPNQIVFPNSGTAGSIVDNNYSAMKTQPLHSSSTQFFIIILFLNKKLCTASLF